MERRGDPDNTGPSKESGNKKIQGHTQVKSYIPGQVEWEEMAK